MTVSQQPSPSRPLSQDPEEQRNTSKAVQQAIEVIFKSTPFRSSRQSQDLLRYILVHSLSGEDQLLRERVIGAEVFGRKPDYDTGEDPVVRLRASDLRKRLAQFYQSDSASGLPLRIEIPSGSYRAAIEWKHPSPSPSLGDLLHPSFMQTTEPAGPVVEALPLAMAAPAMRARLPWIVLASVTVLAIAIGAALELHNRSGAALNAFWGPLMKDTHPALICIGSNAVYRLSSDYLLDYARSRGETHRNMEFLIDPKAGQLMDQRDLLRANDSFVALGDVSATSALVEFLTRKNKAFKERFPQDMSFAEVQENSSIMVGGFNNRMALTIDKDLRFTLEGSNRIRDRQNPNLNWILRFDGDARDSEDYALITRLFDPARGHEIVTVGGIGQYGTQSAADFLTDQDALRQWAKTAPPGWQGKNVQMVLHVKIIDYRPIAREVIATHVW